MPAITCEIFRPFSITSSRKYANLSGLETAGAREKFVEMKRNGLFIKFKERERERKKAAVSI